MTSTDTDGKGLQNKKSVVFPAINLWETLACAALVGFLSFDVVNTLFEAIQNPVVSLWNIAELSLQAASIGTLLYLVARHHKQRRYLNGISNNVQVLYEHALGGYNAKPGADAKPESEEQKLCDILNALGDSQDHLSALAAYKEQFQLERDFYTHILNNTSSLVVWLNPDGTVKYINPAVTRVTEYKMQDLLGKVWWDIFYPGKKMDPQIEVLNKISANGRRSITDHVMTLQSKFGETRYISWATANIYDANGNPLELIGIGHDITSERERAARDTQEQKMQALAKLAGGLAHEISNALQPILGISEICAMQQAGKNAELEECMKIILRNAMHCRNIVNGVLSFSRHDVKKRQLYNLPSLLEEVLIYTDEFLPLEIKVACHGLDDNRGTAENEAVMIMANKTEMVQIMANLFTNASHAMKQCGIIDVTLGRISVNETTAEDLNGLKPGEYAVISVRDTGYGMSEEVQKSLFQPFFTTKTVGEGTGLGLAAVYGIVTDWEGTVKVHSKEGQGTTFFIYVPIIEALHNPGITKLQDKKKEKEPFDENGKHTRH